MFHSTSILTLPDPSAISASLVLSRNPVGRRIKSLKAKQHAIPLYFNFIPPNS